MNWKEQFSVGIPEIDNEHKNLVQGVGDVAKAQTQRELHAAMDRLIFCIRVHCSNEERLMRELNYPNLVIHFNEHKQFLDEVRTIGADIQDSPVSPKTLALLESTLEKHFMADEKDYGVFRLSRTERYSA